MRQKWTKYLQGWKKTFPNYSIDLKIDFFFISRGDKLGIKQRSFLGGGSAECPSPVVTSLLSPERDLEVPRGGISFPLESGPVFLLLHSHWSEIIFPNNSVFSNMKIKQELLRFLGFCSFWKVTKNPSLSGNSGMLSAVQTQPRLKYFKTSSCLSGGGKTQDKWWKSTALN